MTWFSGYRLRFFAAQGLVGDVSDVWTGLDGFSDGFKNACTGDDGKQYMVPLYNYPWALNYSKSLFDEKGYTLAPERAGTGRDQGGDAIGRGQRRVDGHAAAEGDAAAAPPAGWPARP